MIHCPAQYGSVARGHNARGNLQEAIMKRIVCLIASAVLCTPLLARAVEGWVVDDISLQAGPDPAYPSIIELTAGTPVWVEGCIDGFTWCDVAVGPDRGWVPGTFLAEEYGGEPVVIIDYGPRIGIPVVSFSLNVYWEKYYHSRPFYAQREQWVSRSIQPRAPMRPAKSVAGPSGKAPGKAATATATTTTQYKQMPQQPKQTTQQSTRTQSTVATRAAPPPKRPESAPAPKPESQPAKPAESTAQSTSQQTNMAKAKPRSGEPKPKDELKKAPKQNKAEQNKDEHGGEQY